MKYFSGRVTTFFVPWIAFPLLQSTIPIYISEVTLRIPVIGVEFIQLPINIICSADDDYIVNA